MGSPFAGPRIVVVLNGFGQSGVKQVVSLLRNLMTQASFCWNVWITEISLALSFSHKPTPRTTSAAKHIAVTASDPLAVKICEPLMFSRSYVGLNQARFTDSESAHTLPPPLLFTMTTGRNISPLETEDFALHTPIATHRSTESTAKDWLAHGILTVKTIAAGAEFIPFPYIRAAFSTVVIFLETVDKMKKNRDDLQELCAGTVEIVQLLQAELSARGHAAGVRFMGHCEDFISFLRVVQTELEGLVRSRVGFRGRFKEFLRATTVADQINGYKSRINELRSNFLLVTTIDTNNKVASIQKRLSASENSVQFRHIALGDINLLYETAMTSKVHKIKVFTARIAGEPSLMTVAKYEDDNERWQSDLELCSRFRHPNIWQLFGISTTTGLNALIYYDELIPLPIYRKFYRPSSDLVWACIEGMLFTQFKQCSPHHYWSMGDEEKGLEATICVKRERPQLCLTMPGLFNDSGDQSFDHILSSWHTEHFWHQRPAPESFRTMFNTLSAASYPTLETLARHIEWAHFLAALLPLRYDYPTACEMQTKLFLGSVFGEIRGSDELVPVAHIPTSSRIRMQTWTLKQCPNVLLDSGDDFPRKRFTFPAGSFKASQIFMSCLESFLELEGEDEDRVNLSWLSQANRCVSQTTFQEGKPFQYATIDRLRCLLMINKEFCYLLRPEGTLLQAYLFPCPVGVRREGPYTGIEFPETDHFYWSLDPSGTTRMSQDECDRNGLPRWEFLFAPTGNLWHDYHYNAVREFSEARGVDPYSNTVTQLVGLPLAEMESAIKAVEMQ
ncbi:Kinase-like protein [Mycena venus]|uniref:Kinase-like protein n=1 Tax=Mycena venus TaxID=2733690 RepID=A0A8H6YTB6_9AGAR|nr:Kinase-like protein [Mycena venus]